MDKNYFRSLIKHYFLRDKTAKETKEKLDKYYVANTPSDYTVKYWFREFRGGRNSTTDEIRSGRLSDAVTEENVKKIHEMVLADRKVKVRELADATKISTERTRHILGEILHMKKLSCRWVPRMLTPDQKHEQSFFVESCTKKNQTTIIAYKTQHIQKHHTYTRGIQKISSVCIIRLVRSMYERAGNTALKRGSYRIEARHHKRRGMLTAGVSLLHNARPHVAASTTALLNQFSWDVLTHPPYSPDLAPSDYHLFTKLKESLAGKRFQSDEEVQTAVTNWTKELAGSFYAEGISKLVSRYTKCIEIDGNYVEKD
ncbi:SETMR methyltransferase, partial [Acromyrmex insinuator]